MTEGSIDLRGRKIMDAMYVDAEILFDAETCLRNVVIDGCILRYHSPPPVPRDWLEVSISNSTIDLTVTDMGAKLTRDMMRIRKGPPPAKGELRKI